jgi:PAS domain S-box-containing protein
MTTSFTQRQRKAPGRRAEKRSREEEAIFRSLAEQNIAGIVIVRDDGTIGYCNGYLANLIGYAPEEIVDRPLLDFVPETEQPIVVRSLRSQLVETGDPVQIASTVRARDGSIIEVLVNASKSTFEGRSASIAVVVDVTSRNQAQRELASTTAILAAEHESSPDGILVVDPIGRIISVNRRFNEMFDVPAELLASHDVSPLLALALQHVADADAFLSRVRYLRGNPDEFAHDELVLKDGRVLDRFTSPFKTCNGEYLGRIWYFRDITERLKAEETLRSSEERFRLLVEEAPDAIALYDCDQDRLVGTNKAAERLFGVPREEILANSPRRFFAPEQPDALPLVRSFLEHNERALAGEEVTFERRIRRPSGEERVCRATLVRLPSPVRLLRASLVDITSQSRAHRELASTAAILAAEHESSPDGILVIDLKARIISVNRRFSEIFNTPAEVLEAGDDEPVLALNSQRVLDGDAFVRRVRYLYDHPEESAHDELVLKDGRVLDRFTSSFKGPDGEWQGRIWFFRDISERLKVAESLRASEERFRMLVEEAPDAILLYDCDQDRLVATNRAAERLFGVPRDEILAQGPRRFLAPKQPDGRPLTQSFSAHNKRALAGGEVTFERLIRRPSGEERLCQVTLVRLPSTIRLLRASLVDITDQRATEAQLSEALRSTVSRQEAERQRIARELHDALGQYLAAMNVRLDIFGRSVPDVSPLKSGLAELKSLTATVGDEVRRLAWELRPTALDDIGLESAIQHFVAEWAQRSGLRFDLHLTLNDRRLPANVETTLYRVLQEGMTNIVKHAGASKVGVILMAPPDGVVMIIEDDGKGFELEDLSHPSSSRLGLLGIRERLALIHGSLEIETKPGAGTTLIIRVPLLLTEHSIDACAVGP